MPRARISAPTPTGPPSLCADTASASAPLAAKSTGSCAAAWTASVWNGMPYSCATAASSATGCTVPTSLFAHITLTTATWPAARETAARSASGHTAPSTSTPSQTGSAPCVSSSQRTESRTAWCSTEVVSTCRREPSWRAQYRPLTARLSASVPPLVKTTSLGRAPNTSASCSRDSSTTRRARLPAACSDEGLPSRASSSVIAVIASGRMGVVAA